LLLGAPSFLIWAAMKEGLLLAISVGCNAIVAESDSLETVEACTGNKSGGMIHLQYMLLTVWIWHLQLEVCLLNIFRVKQIR
jgi:hypothetical protein